MAGEKRSQDHDNALRQETIVLIDIEGTTTSISFVKDTLFPYVREHLKAYIEKKWDDDELKADIESLKEQAKKDETDKVEGLVAIAGEADELKESLIKNVFWQMDNDRKTSALKQLQGHIWRDAYKSGVVKGHVYEDVPTALEAWIKDGRKVYVYSSGSVEAQKLLFGHSEHGDLLKYLTGYFDTEVGPKQKASSYKTILAKIDCEASKVLFLTDIANEAKAAVEAGMSSALVVREGNAALTDEEKAAYPTINSFLELSFQAPSKRPKLEETEKPKKAEEPAATAASETAVEDVEMTDVSEKTVEKTDEPEAKTVVEAEKKTEPSEKSAVEEAKKTDEAMETCEAPADTPKDKEKHSDELKTTKKTDELVEKVSTEATKPETEKKSPPEPTVDEKKIETAPKKSSESTSKSTESKTEKAEVVEEKTAEPKVVEAKAEVSAEEPEAATTKVSVEAKATEEVVAEVKPEEVKPEQSVVAKTEDKKIEPEEKVAAVVVEDKKQNGEAKSAPEATSITNGAEVNGSTTSEKSVKQSEPETKVDSAQPEAVEVAAESVAAVEPAATAEDETKAASPAGTVAAAATETAEKKLNGSAPSSDKAADSTDTKTHRNGVTDENKQNGEEETSLADKEAIKVKKVVESLAADGAAESEVVPPVAVVAATS